MILSICKLEILIVYIFICTNHRLTKTKKAIEINSIVIFLSGKTIKARCKLHRLCPRLLFLK